MEFRSDHKVTYINHMGDDLEIVEDARTSLRKIGDNKPLRNDDRTLTDRDYERILDFMKFRHSSTLRGNILKVEVETTISMQRQMRTHWVGNRQLWPDMNIEWFWEESDILGFNDQSGKFSIYKPIFYIPSRDLARVERDDFKPMTPTYRRASPNEYDKMKAILEKSHQQSWEAYQELLKIGVSREIARDVIPGAMFVSGRITMNLNAAFGLMSLRIDDPDNLTETKPQAEIEVIARGIESIVKEHWPVAHSVWKTLGRTRP